MENNITFDYDTVRELNRMMYTTYKFFSMSLASMSEKPKVAFTVADQVHLQTQPHDFYSLQCGDVKISIHQIRTHYTLESCGYYTSLFPAYKKNYEERYRNCFGDFADFETAQRAFYLLCNEYLTTNCGALF